MEELLRRFVRAFHDRLQHMGSLTQSQYCLLKVLDREGHCTVSDVAQRLDMTVAGATGLIDRLVRANLVTRQREETDRRVVRVALSPEGVAAIGEACRQRRELMSEFLSPLAPAELDQLIALYEKMALAFPLSGAGAKEPKVKE
jgi:DNA-binding MarR family transcriptional regulator